MERTQRFFCRISLKSEPLPCGNRVTFQGETFFNLERPEECIVISKWTTIEHWQAWEKDPRRLELNKNMEIHLGAKTEYNVFGIGLW